MFDLLPFEHRQRNLVNYFDSMERSLFGCKTDILDRGDHYLLQTELPGFERGDLKIDVKGDRLTLSAEHKGEKEEKKDNFVRRERHYGSYMRSFDVSDVDVEHISATYKDGVLELKLPKSKTPETESRQIEIK